MINGGVAAVLLVFCFLLGISLGAIGGMIYALKIFFGPTKPSLDPKKVDRKKYNELLDKEAIK